MVAVRLHAAPGRRADRGRTARSSARSASAARRAPRRTRRSRWPARRGQDARARHGRPPGPHARRHVLPTAQRSRRLRQGRRSVRASAHYKVHASRRDAAGQVEVHTKDTDIIYVLDGSATFVTGGPTSTARHRSRRRSGRGDRRAARRRPLEQGDVVVVPNGTPHWFKDVQRSDDLLRREGALMRASRLSWRTSMLATTRSGRSWRPSRGCRRRGAAAVHARRPRRRPCRSSTWRPRAASGSSRAQWRYRDATHRRGRLNAPRVRDLKPTGAPIRTYDITPHAGAADFDDSAWEHDRPDGARDARRGTAGSASTGTASRSPSRSASAPSTRPGSTVVFEIVVDDYAEVWVDGKLPRRARPDRRRARRRASTPRTASCSARDVQARPADPARGLRHERPALGPAGELHLDALGDARLLPRRPGRPDPTKSVGEVVRLDPALDAIVPPSAARSRSSRGLPVHRRTGLGAATAATCSSAIRTPTTIYRWTPDGRVCRSSARRAATPASTSASTASPARTG